MATAFTLTDGTFRSSRHTTYYWKAGPTDWPLMVFLHGWPEIGLVRRAQGEAFASEGWHGIAPDIHGYFGSSAPTASEAYALKEIVSPDPRQSAIPHGAVYLSKVLDNEQEVPAAGKKPGMKLIALAVQAAGHKPVGGPD
jgi:dienelactone hydrolase